MKKVYFFSFIFYLAFISNTLNAQHLRARPAGTRSRIVNRQQTTVRQTTARQTTARQTTTTPVPETTKPEVIKPETTEEDSGKYYGTYLGSFLTNKHQVSGDIFAVDESTIFIKNFNYDGLGPDAYFWGGINNGPDQNGFIIPDEKGSTKPLAKYSGQNLILRLPEGKTLRDITYISIWCKKFSVNFGHLELSSVVKTSTIPTAIEIRPLSQVDNGVKTGPVNIIDTQTFLITDFHFDSSVCKESYWWVSKGDKQNPKGTKLADENGSLKPLRRYSGETIVISLPDNKTIYDFDFLGIWCDELNTDFGNTRIPHNILVPPSLKILGLTPEVIYGELNKNEQPDKIEVQTASFITTNPTTLMTSTVTTTISTTTISTTTPVTVAPNRQKLKNNPLFDRSIIDGSRLQLNSINRRRPPQRKPELNSKKEIDHFEHMKPNTIKQVRTRKRIISNVSENHLRQQVHNSTPGPFNKNNVLIKDEKEFISDNHLNSIGSSRFGHRSKLNCEVLLDEQGYELRWVMDGDDIVMQLVAKIDPNEYMAFGLSKNDTKSEMIGSDAVVAYFDHSQGRGHAIDYYLESKDECKGTSGSCPDVKISSNLTDSITLLNGIFINGYTMITFKRPQVAVDDIYDQHVYSDGPQAVIWSIGPLNENKDISFHYGKNSNGNIYIDFARTPKWNCPSPQTSSTNEENQPSNRNIKNFHNVDILNSDREILNSESINTWEMPPTNSKKKLKMSNGLYQTESDEINYKFKTKNLKGNPFFFSEIKKSLPLQKSQISKIKQKIQKNHNVKFLAKSTTINKPIAFESTRIRNPQSTNQLTPKENLSKKNILNINFEKQNDRQFQEIKQNLPKNTVPTLQQRQLIPTNLAPVLSTRKVNLNRGRPRAKQINDNTITYIRHKLSSLPLNLANYQLKPSKPQYFKQAQKLDIDHINLKLQGGFIPILNNPKQFDYGRSLMKVQTQSRSPQSPFNFKMQNNYHNVLIETVTLPSTTTTSTTTVSSLMIPNNKKILSYLANNKDNKNFLKNDQIKFSSQPAINVNLKVPTGIPKLLTTALPKSFSSRTAVANKITLYTEPNKRIETTTVTTMKPISTSSLPSTTTPIPTTTQKVAESFIKIHPVNFGDLSSSSFYHTVHVAAPLKQSEVKPQNTLSNHHLGLLNMNNQNNGKITSQKLSLAKYQSSIPSSNKVDDAILSHVLSLISNNETPPEINLNKRNTRIKNEKINDEDLTNLNYFDNGYEVELHEKLDKKK